MVIKGDGGGGGGQPDHKMGCEEEFSAVIEKVWFSCRLHSAPFCSVFNRWSMIMLPFVINLNVMRHETQAPELEVMTARYVLSIIVFVQRDS